MFSDEGEIFKDSDNPDLKYNQVIRPWKSRLGLFYTEHQSAWVDLQIIMLTVLAIVSRPQALKGVQHLLRLLGADEQLITIAGRNQPLVPHPPPGAGGPPEAAV